MQVKSLASEVKSLASNTMYLALALQAVLNLGSCGLDSICDYQTGKVAVSWLKILAANPNPTILSQETAT